MGKENIVDDGILVSEAVYEISGDGNYIAYLKNENQKECLYLYDLNKNSSIKLGEEYSPVYITSGWRQCILC